MTSPLEQLLACVACGEPGEGATILPPSGDAFVQWPPVSWDRQLCPDCRARVGAVLGSIGFLVL